ncbi:cytochrome P450 [Streptomyces mashuensis]|uniref:cytochrome P450 n=1 Tax=Streptomyces mashuensis TaxID=33904 RepID=UPI00167CA23A|nr:cytochrome P450 [Streptomyces mashuensis]
MDSPAPQAHALLFSLFSPEGRENPHPALEALRRTAPVHHAPGLNTYFLTSFAHCRAVLADPAHRAPDLVWRPDDPQGWRERPAAHYFRSALSSVPGADGTGRTRLRQLLGEEFTPRRVASLEAAVERITHGLLDDLAEALWDGGTVDFQAVVGHPLAVEVIGELIGVPPADRARFRALGDDAGRLLEPIRTRSEWSRAALAVEQLRAYFRELAEQRRLEPADDLVDALLLVFLSGVETTAGLLGPAVHALLTHPAQRAMVAAAPHLVPPAVEEAVRWDTPVLMAERIAGRAGIIGGVRIPEGAHLTVVLAAAHRDPARHPDPHRFDVARAGSELLGFGTGPHHGVATALARTAATVAVRRLLTRFPRLVPAGKPVRRRSFTLRVFADLPVAGGATTAAAFVPHWGRATTA